MKKAVSDALRRAGKDTGKIVLKGWIIKTIYALDSKPTEQDLDPDYFGIPE